MPAYPEQLAKTMPTKIAQRIALIAVMSCPAVAGAQVAANPEAGQPDFSIVVEGTFDPETVAELIGEILSNDALRSRILAGQSRVVEELKAIDYSALLLDRLQAVLQ